MTTSTDNQLLADNFPSFYLGKDGNVCTHRMNQDDIPIRCNTSADALNAMSTIQKTLIQRDTAIGAHLEQEQLARQTMRWATTNETGLSSRTLAAAILNIPPQTLRAPRDSADFLRCLKPLEAAPSARDHLHKAAKLSYEWLAIVERWDQIERELLREIGLNYENGTKAPATNQLIKEARKTAKEHKALSEK